MAGGKPTRRSFIAGALTSAVVLPGFVSTAAAQTSTTMTAWRLDPDWGYPRGPNGKTHLFSNASRNAARYRWALTEPDGLNMNLHLGSWAPAVPVAVDRDAFMQIWDAGSYIWRNPWNGADVRIFDERRLPQIPGSGPVWDRAMSPFIPAVYVPGSNEAPEDPLLAAVRAANAPSTPAGVTAAPATPAAAPAGSGFLAVTGDDVSLRAALSLGFIASGAAFMRISQRRRELFEQEQARLDAEQTLR